MNTVPIIHLLDRLVCIAQNEAVLPMIAEAPEGWAGVAEGGGGATLTWRGTAPDPAATLEAALLAALDFAAGASRRSPPQI